MDLDAKIYVAGHRGLVGSAILRKLQQQGYSNLIARTHAELDLTDGAAVARFFQEEAPQYVFLAAAKVGGIQANHLRRGEFIHENLLIQTHVIHQCYLNHVKKLLFLGSSCIYPKHCPQPMKEEHLLSGTLEPTNEAYAIAKIAGIAMCQSYNQQYGTNFVAVMPTNAYGPHDNYDLEASHVLPALLRKFHEAKIQGNAPVTLWGSGRPFREFLYSEDMAEGCVHVMNHIHAGDSPGDFYNLGVGKEISIGDLALKIQRVVGHGGDIVWDAGKPDGTPRKLLDVSRLSRRGWQATTSLEEGLQKSYQWFLHHENQTG